MPKHHQLQTEGSEFSFKRCTERFPGILPVNSTNPARLVINRCPVQLILVPCRRIELCFVLGKVRSKCFDDFKFLYIGKVVQFSDAHD